METAGTSSPVDDLVLLEIISKHSRKFICTKCNLKFKNAQRYCEHKRDVHPRYTCGECKYKCLLFSKFKEHLSTYKKCREFLLEIPVIDLTKDEDNNTTAPTQPPGMNSFLTKIFLIFT